MSFVEILDTLLLKPLQLIFEIIYSISNRLIGDWGISIIALSLAINLLVLPLYRRADAMQEEQREMEMRLQKGVAHIKKTFRGDEQMLMLQTYYRQNGYKSTYVLRGAASLLLQIPFFIAAYRFLSGLQLLDGVALGPISSLGQPDQLLKIGGISVNVLPFVMTAVNLVSCVIFTKDSPLKTKLQLYGMAAFFLVFLYSSPSGLVFYWTLNNVFSLVKTCVYKLKNPGKVCAVVSSAAGICVWAYAFASDAASVKSHLPVFAAAGLLLQIPSAYVLLKKTGRFQIKPVAKAPQKTVFLAGGVFLSVLTGILIPSAVIASSPQEFISDIFFYHPGWFIVSSFCFALGIFVIWMGVFYWLSGAAVKRLFEKAVWIFSGIAVIDYMAFNKNFGDLSSGLKYESHMEFTRTELLCSLAVAAAAAVLLAVVYQYFEKHISGVLAVATAAIGIMSAVNVVSINSSIAAVEKQLAGGQKQSGDDLEMPGFTLSKNGKNVIVLMLDRAMGELVPYLFDEKPELKEQFDGFTYYSNVVSYGGHTNMGAPALLGGYEYTPVELNSRADESLVSKHNEALKVMPVLFDQNGYEVTVINPVYANYQEIPDLTVYDEYPDIKRCNTGDKFIGSLSAEALVKNNKRNFFCYGLFKALPLCMQGALYSNGSYNKIDNIDESSFTGQFHSGPLYAKGIKPKFMSAYSVLENLPYIGSIVEEEADTFLFMVNDTTHEAMLLQEPDYVPEFTVDNTMYEDTPPKRVLDGRVLRLEDLEQMALYQTNMAAMLQLGKWFDYMRQEGVYDNTRIILVSDHGHSVGMLDELILDNGSDISSFYPLLMVKDFGSEGFAISDAFMTNADVPTMAVDGVIENPINPFTGNLLCSDEKTAHSQYILGSHLYDVNENNGNTFLPGVWYSVQDDIWDKNNWKRIAEEAVLSVKDYK